MTRRAKTHSRTPGAPRREAAVGPRKPPANPEEIPVAIRHVDLGAPRPDSQNLRDVVRLGPFESVLGESGIFIQGSEAVLRREGEDLARRPLSAATREPSAALETSWEDPRTGPRTTVGTTVGTAGHGLAALFPEHEFAYSPPLVVSRASAVVGSAGLRADLTGQNLELAAVYEPSLYTAFDGDILLTLDDGAVHQAGFREWRRNVMNLDGYPEHYRRVVRITLPEALSTHREDTVLLLILGRLVCELVGAYVASGGGIFRVHGAAPFTNVFRGDQAPDPASAPALLGRHMGNVHATAPETTLLPG